MKTVTIDVIHGDINRSERMKDKAHGAQEPECIGLSVALRPRTPSTAQRRHSFAQ